MIDHLMPDEAHAVWDLLVELAGASEDGRDDFVAYLTTPLGFHEYRFGGSLGHGGKLHRESRGLRVSVYRDRPRPERDRIVAEVNARLDEMFSEVPR